MKYLLTKSKDDPMWWTLTDTEEQIVCRFKEGEFRETYRLAPADDSGCHDMTGLQNIAAAMEEWLRENHYAVFYYSPQTVREECRADIGRQIRRQREARGITLRELAGLTGIAFNHISRIEQGRYNMTVDTLALIARVLGGKIEIG